MNNTALMPDVLAMEKSDEWLAEAKAWLCFYRAIINDDEMAAQQAFINNKFTEIASVQLHNENLEWAKNIVSGKYVTDEYPDTAPYFEELLMSASLSQEEIYKKVMAEHVKDDIINEAEEIGIEITDEQAEKIARRYAYDGDYDTNLPYWNNLDNLIEEEKGNEQI